MSQCMEHSASFVKQSVSQSLELKCCLDKNVLPSLITDMNLDYTLFDRCLCEFLFVAGCW